MSTIELISFLISCSLFAGLIVSLSFYYRQFIESLLFKNNYKSTDTCFSIFCWILIINLFVFVIYLNKILNIIHYE